MELSLQQRLAAVYHQDEQARQQATRYEEAILKKAKTNLDLNRQSYEAGQAGTGVTQHPRRLARFER